MSPVSDTDAYHDCEKLSHDYGRHADANEADKLAELFTEDGVLDRLGTQIKGREQIRHFIANRPTDIWQRHHGSHFTFQLGDDGVTATGTLDLVLERGKVGETEVSDTVYARYDDQFVRTDAGWKFKLRRVVLKEPSA